MKTRRTVVGVDTAKRVFRLTGRCGDRRNRGARADPRAVPGALHRPHARGKRSGVSATWTRSVTRTWRGGSWSWSANARRRAWRDAASRGGARSSAMRGTGKWRRGRRRQSERGSALARPMCPMGEVTQIPTTPMSGTSGRNGTSRPCWKNSLSTHSRPQGATPGGRCARTPAGERCRSARAVPAELGVPGRAGRVRAPLPEGGLDAMEHAQRDGGRQRRAPGALFRKRCGSGGGD